MIQGLSASGELTADEVVSATTRGTNAHGELRLEDGHMLLTSFELPTDLGVPKEILEALTDSDGRVNLPILVAGSQLSPSVAFNRSSWGKLVKKRVQNEIEKELGKALGRLFAKDKKDG